LQGVFLQRFPYMSLSLLIYGVTSDPPLTVY
jgi:hypothetical protein